MIKRETMYIFKISVYFCGTFLLALLGSCNQPNRKVVSVQEKMTDNYRVAIELILNDSTKVNSLLENLKENKLELYKWKNHIVLFGDATDTICISKMIYQSRISLKIKRYAAPVYVFDRQMHCGTLAVDQPWNNYLLTANLVADTTMQREYMHYHQVQFQEWPEVAQGFCNAEFQQLLTFRNERQLLIVISVPANKTLDELNPKTEENNPRVVEWNKLMSKYQEGIEGTKPGETWVFLNKVNIMDH